MLYITGSIASRYPLPIACQRPQKKEVQGIILKCEHAQSSGLQASQLVREGGREFVSQGPIVLSVRWRETPAYGDG
jgi:hypothetical protein